jgi:hypothetical protein
MAKRTVMEQLTAAGETALEQLASSQVGRRALESAMGVKDRFEKIVRTVSDLDGRVSTLEKRVATLEKAKRAPAGSRTTAAKKSTAKPSAKPRARAASKT